MAVQKVDKGFVEYIGLSTDTKPTPSAGYGHKFKEIDTDKKFIWNGTAWVQSEVLTAITAILTVASLPGAATSVDSTVLDMHLKYPKQLAFAVAGTFAATAATTGLRLQVFYSPDETNWDTDAYAIIEPTFTASSGSAQTKQKSRPVTAVPGYYKCNVVNLDGTNAATAVTVTAIEVV